MLVLDIEKLHEAILKHRRTPREIAAALVQGLGMGLR